MKRIYWITICFALLVCSTKIYSNWKQNEKTETDYVPDAATAIKVAEAIWLPIFGEKRINQEKPFKAGLTNDGVWIVEGTLTGPKDSVSPRSISITVGGVAYIEIRKSDCKILKVSHGK